MPPKEEIDSEHQPVEQQFDESDPGSAELADPPFPDPLPDQHELDREPVVERELTLDHFLDETTALRVATEEALDDLAQWPQPDDEPPVNTFDPNFFRESLEQLSYTLGAKFELVNSFVRDSTEVLDGRLAMTTRLLSERADEATVGISQIFHELADVSQQLKEARNQLAAVLEHQSTPDDPRNDLSVEQAVDLSEKIMQTSTAGTQSILRRQHDLDDRIAKLEAALSRNARKPARKTENAYFSLAVLLLFVNALMILWLRFGQ